MTPEKCISVFNSRVCHTWLFAIYVSRDDNSSIVQLPAWSQLSTRWSCHNEMCLISLRYKMQREKQLIYWSLSTQWLNNISLSNTKLTICLHVFVGCRSKKEEGYEKKNLIRQLIWQQSIESNQETIITT